MVVPDPIGDRFSTMADRGDWRGPALAHLRALIKQAAPDIVEEIKWRKPSNPDGVLAYSRGGLIGTLEVYRDKVKFTFAKGRALPPPLGMPWLGTGTRRAIDLFEDDVIDEEAFKDLIRAAVSEAS